MSANWVRVSTFIKVAVLGSLVGLVSAVNGQTNFVLRTGDVMSGPLAIEAQGDQISFAPGLELFGASNQYKFVRMHNTSDGAIWDLTMDADSNGLDFWYSPDGANTWSIPFAIDTNGILYGNAAGLSNLNVALAIPDGSISSAKLLNGSIGTAKIADGSITLEKLVSNAVAGATIQDYSIADVDIATNAAIAISKVAELQQTLADLQQQIDNANKGASIVMVEVTDDEVVNGANLVAAYEEAKNLLPNGKPLANDNRAVVMLPAGRYNLGQAGIQLDAEFVDLIGQVPAQVTKRAKATMIIDGQSRAYVKTVWSGRNPSAHLIGSRSVVIQIANNVHLENLYVETTYAYEGYAAYWPNIMTQTVIRHCRFQGNGDDIDVDSSMRGSFDGDVEFSGYYEDCMGDWDCWGSDDCVASGTFVSCIGGEESFGGYSGNASGIFIDCSADYFSFGGGNYGSSGNEFGDGIASGVFVGCSAGPSSFGATISSSAVLINCSASGQSFGPFKTSSTRFNYDASGYHFAGGPIKGDGSGLVNLNVSAAIPSGSITTDKLSSEVAAASISTNDIASWHEVASLANHVQNSSNGVKIATNLVVQGLISGDGSGLSSVSATSLVGKVSSDALPGLDEMVGSESFSWSQDDLANGASKNDSALIYQQWSDVLQFSPILSLEYFDSTNWVDWSENISEFEKLLDGDPRNYITVEPTQRKWRLVVDALPWCGLGIVQITHFFNGSWNDMTWKVERSSSIASAEWEVLSEGSAQLFGGPHYDNNVACRIADGASSQRYYRITVEALDTVNAEKWASIRGLSANVYGEGYRGLPFSWDYDRNMYIKGTYHGDGSGLTNLTVSSAIPTASITADKISDGAIDALRLAVGAVTQEKIVDGSVTASKLANNAVVGASIADYTISNADISTNAAIALSKIDGLESILAELQQAVSYSNAASVTVEVTGDEIVNGQNLQAAYAMAKTMNPSASNRVAVIVPPGRYDVGTNGLVMDTEYVDLIGQTTDREVQYLFGSPGQYQGVIKQIVDSVRIENLSLESKSWVDLWAYESDPAAYYPTVSGSNTTLRNCHFVSVVPGARSMRSPMSYAGYYKDCEAGNESFGGDDGKASGTFVNCVAGDSSFGGDGGEASGTFIECQGGFDSFGGYDGYAFGTFLYCTAGRWSFGGNDGWAEGRFVHCRGGSYSFGGGRGGGWASGTFEQCIAGEESFGGALLSDVVLINCTAGANSFGHFDFAATNFNYNASGYHFAGGPIKGDGSGLTLDLAAYTGSNLIWQSNQLHAAAGYSDSNAVDAVLARWANLDTDATDDFDGAFSNLVALPAGLLDGDDVLSASDVVSIVSDNGFATVSNVNAVATDLLNHLSSSNNPHGVVAWQVGAYDTNQTYSRNETLTEISNAVAAVDLSGFVANTHTGSVSVVGEVNVESNLYTRGSSIVGSPVFIAQVVSNLTEGSLYVEHDLNVMGKLSGDGSNLTLNLESYVGENLVWQSNKLHAAADYSDLNAVDAVLARWANLDTDATDDFDGTFSNLVALPAGLLDGDDVLSASEVVSIVTDNGFATVSNLNVLTADDVGAYSTNEVYTQTETYELVTNKLAGIQIDGYVATNHNGDVSISGTVDVADPVEPSDAVNLGYMTNFIRQAFSYVPKQGDLSMGSFTNSTVANPWE